MIFLKNKFFIITILELKSKIIFVVHFKRQKNSPAKLIGIKNQDIFKISLSKKVNELPIKKIDQKTNKNLSVNWYVFIIKSVLIIF